MPNKLYEFMSYDNAELILEHSEDGKDLYMKGVFIQGDVKNQNQRVYPITEINKAVIQINERIQTGETVLGELDHPEELSINLDRVSHIITEMGMRGNDGHGSLKIIPTPTGNIVKTLLESGAKLGVSSRGSGNVGNDGYVSEFEIITIDIVAQPSAPNAYPRTIYESLFNMRGGQTMYNLAADATHDKVAERYLAKDITKFIKDLKI
jgi:hypothetical protein